MKTPQIYNTDFMACAHQSKLLSSELFLFTENENGNRTLKLLQEYVFTYRTFSNCGSYPLLMLVQMAVRKSEYF